MNSEVDQHEQSLQYWIKPEQQIRDQMVVPAWTDLLPFSAIHSIQYVVHV